MSINKSTVSFLTIAFLLALTPFFAQVNNTSLSKMPIRVYGSGMDSLVKENINWALKKFWNKTPINDPSKETEGRSLIEVEDYEVITGDGFRPKYYLTQYVVKTAMNHNGLPHMVNPFAFGSDFMPFVVPFDNIRKSKNSDEIIGSDKDMRALAYKSLSYTMYFCYMVNHFCIDYGKGKKENKKMNKQAWKQAIIDGKTKLKESTVLVPKELIDNGLNEEDLKSTPMRYKIESSEEIAKRIKEGKDVKNYSHFLYFREGRDKIGIRIMDIETGQLLASGYKRPETNLQYTIKMQPRLIIKLIKKFYK